MNRNQNISAILAATIFLTCNPCAAQTDSHNYDTKTIILKDGIKTDAQIAGATVKNAIKTITYYDSFGYPEQEITMGGSADGLHDLVKHHEYDEHLRERRIFLPYIDNSGQASGNFREDSYSKTLSYYSSASGLAQARTSAPFAIAEYEESLLDRILGQGAPGESWQPSQTRGTTGRTVVTDYGTCSESGADAVRKWEITSSGLASCGNWKPGSLARKTIKDENWISGRKGTSDKFTDISGHDILEREWISEEKSLDTYYIYDDIGRLRYVLPPLLSAQAEEMPSIAESAALMKEYGYVYKYNGTGNCIWKRLPGCEPFVTVYDKALRPVMTQDGNQRARGEWNIVFYDNLGRPAVYGTCRSDITSSAQSNTFTASFTGSGQVFGYDISPAGGISGTFSPHTIRYYDNYDFISIFEADIRAELNFHKFSGYSDKSDIVSGLETGSILVTLSENAIPVIEARHYDDNGRCIQITTVNHLGGIDRKTMEYSFTEKIIKSCSSHTMNSSSEAVEESCSYTYDHLDRPLKIKHKAGNGQEMTLADYVYDDIGNLAVNRRNGSENLVTTYSYNARAWNTSIRNNIFREHLSYDKTDSIPEAVPQYNGAISAISWQVCDFGNKIYKFNYDGAGRLSETSLSVAGNGNAFNKKYLYDGNGNIVSVTNDNGGTIERLAFSHNGNRLASATFSASGKSDRTFGTFSYDANGNMTSDGLASYGDHDTETALSYNLLNLPYAVTSDNFASTYYTYIANGTKLRTKTVRQGKTSVTDYCSNMVYMDGALQRMMTEGGYIENGQYRFFVTDHVGSIRAVTDAAGTVLQTYDYHPYGAVLENTDSQVGNPDAAAQPYRFNGKESQEFAGLQYLDYGARFYNPLSARWLTPDPLAEKYYSISPYAFCAGNPISLYDYNGADIVLTGKNKSSLTVKTDLVNWTFSVSRLGIDWKGNHTVEGKGVVGAALDIAGIVDPSGVADIMNAGLQIADHDYLGAAISSAGIIPYIGDLAKVTKIQKDLKLISDAVPELRPFTSKNFRQNLIKNTGKNPAGMDAHHTLPQKFKFEFDKADINIHDPRFGMWVEKHRHRQGAFEYNRKWNIFFEKHKDVPATKEDIRKYLQELNKEFNY